MVNLEIILEGDGALEHVRDKIVEGALSRVMALPGGMASGLPSVAVTIDLPDGRVAFGETSARNLVMAARAILARYPEVDGQ